MSDYAQAEYLVQTPCGCAPGRNRANGTSHSDECNRQTVLVATAISKARAEGRREGMEEAARLVENQGAELHMREDEGIDRFDAAMILAANIRAFAQKGKDEAVGDVIGSAWDLSDETKAQIAAIDANRANAARNADKPTFQNYGAGSLSQKEAGKDAN